MKILVDGVQYESSIESMEEDHKTFIFGNERDQIIYLD
jgi:hypothetical protein